MPDDDFDSDDPVDEVVQTPEEELEKEKKKAVALDSLMTAVRFGIQSQVTELLEENRDLVNMMGKYRGHAPKICFYARLTKSFILFKHIHRLFLGGIFR